MACGEHSRFGGNKGVGSVKKWGTGVLRYGMVGLDELTSDALTASAISHLVAALPAIYLSTYFLLPLEYPC